MIHFIGAGPGDPELITLKGRRLIDEADVIIFAGSLVNPKVLDGHKPDAKIYDSAYMDLEEVTKVEIEAEKKGLKVVRVHTGDPSIYGAIREQMDILEKEGIEFDVIPGVSSFVATAAALKKEYTLPDVSQTIIITRMEGRTPMPPKEKLIDLAKHNAQYPPIDVKPFDKVHDRFLCIDNTVYHIGASLKDLGKKWFAFTKMEMPMEELIEKM